MKPENKRSTIKDSNDQKNIKFINKIKKHIQ